MIRMIQSRSSAQAKAYFREALDRSDYFISDQELPGNFTGKLSTRLQIEGLADKKTFDLLCDNINPLTGGSLTPRTKEERTVGYDISFAVPKSVSIAHAFAKDDHVLQLFEKAVDETLIELESDSMTRVREGGKNEERKTGELLIASFTHLTARPVDDMPPDMHLHRHCYVFNATFDPIEQKIKAVQFREIKRDMMYYQNRFFKRLSDKLIDHGYGIRMTEKAFEIESIPQIAINQFSKRSKQVLEYAREHGITDPDEIAELAAKTRAKKQNGQTMAELKSAWLEQMSKLEFTPDELEKSVRFGDKVKEVKLTTKDCVDHSIAHSFEKASVIQDRRLLANGIKHSIGERHLSIEDIEQATSADQRIINVEQGHLTYCTTTEALAEEREMVQLARKGQGRFRPLYDKAPAIKYGGDQGAAIEHVLTTPNQTSIIRGVAGAGKTTALLELDRLIKEVGIQPYYVTPMSETARETLPKEGFENANTVAALLKDKELQAKLKSQALILEEGGQLGVGDMKQVLKIVDEQKARLIIVGDVRQHNPVMRGDSLRLLNTIGGIKSAEVTKIYRQRNNPEYLSAMEDLSNGDVASAFEKLDDMGAVKDIDLLQPDNELAAEYAEITKRGKSALIISPTHKQGKFITDHVRDKLRKDGRIGKKETSFRKLESMNFTEAQKGDWRNYEPGFVVQFEQNVPKIWRGSSWKLKEVTEKGVIMESDSGKTQSLPLNRGNAFVVYRETELNLTKGDQIRMTHGGQDKEDKRLNNGQRMTVVNIARNGDLHLKNEISKATYIVGKDFGHIDHAYCSTSHSAQGKTVDKVLIWQPADSFDATDAKQFYVSCSRGREAISLYTDKKDQLLEHASRKGDRKSAMELVGDDYSGHEEMIIKMEADHRARENALPKREDIIPYFTKFHEDYEPGL